MILVLSGIAWKGNGDFTISTYDKPNGSQDRKTERHKLMYHKLGTAQSEDAIIFGGDEIPRRCYRRKHGRSDFLLVITAANANLWNGFPPTAKPAINAMASTAR